MVQQEKQIDFYEYAAVPSLTGSVITWLSSAPPEECRSNWITILTSLGVDSERLKNFTLYTRNEGNMWESLIGSSPETVLFPVGVQSDEKVVALDTEYLRIGKQIVSKYKELQERRVELSTGFMTDEKREFLEDVNHKIKLIDAAVAGTGEMAKIFDLWARKRYKKSNCAKVMLLSERTWARRCNDVAVHIAKELTRNLTAAELKSLLAESGEVSQGAAIR